MKRTNFMKMLILSLVVVSAVACNSKKNENEKVDMHTSEISLDWAGGYSGILPCADCEGISTELTLNSDGTYQLISQYLGKEELIDTVSGEFTWNEEGNVVKLGGIQAEEGSALYRVEENRLRFLDIEANVIEGDLADNYILVKNGNPLVEDKKWQLVEIYGKEVEGTSETHYLQFHSETGVAEAFADCNVINLEYKIKDELLVNFTAGAMTLKACSDDEVEQELLKVFEEADNLSTDGENLSLSKARMAPLAIFRLVENE